MCISLPIAAGMGALWLGTEETLHDQAALELQTATRTAMSTIEQQLAMDLTHLKAWSTLSLMQDVLIGDQGGELQKAINDLSLNYADFTSLTITNAQGQVVVTTDAALRHANLSNLEGVQAAVSGRVSQSNFSVLRQGSSETILFTVPLVANYDRQTVIGTLIGSIDFGVLAKRVMANSPLNVERRALVITHRTTGRIIYSSRTSDGVTAEIGKIDANKKNQPNHLTIGGEDHLATLVHSKGTSLEKNPDLVAFALAPTASVFAAADKVSNIFLTVAGLAAIGAIFIAWQWSTPLVHLTTKLAQVARGDASVSPLRLPSHNTFSPLDRALDAMNEMQRSRKELLEGELERHDEFEDAKIEALNTERQLQNLQNSLKDEVSTILELCALINKENLATAGSKRNSSYVQELSRNAARLLLLVESTIDRPSDDVQSEMDTLERKIA
jgi:hypothetical protein